MGVKGRQLNEDAMSLLISMIVSAIFSVAEIFSAAAAVAPHWPF
jgi:hypothetical protein